jgi:hypothetical protein
VIGAAAGSMIEPAEAGLLHHHELFPVFELIIGGALPVAAGAWLARLRSASARLAGSPVRDDAATADPAADSAAGGRPQALPTGHHTSGSRPPA